MGILCLNNFGFQDYCIIFASENKTEQYEKDRLD